MKKKRHFSLLICMTILFTIGNVIAPTSSSDFPHSLTPDGFTGKVVDIDGEQIEVGPDEVLYSYALSYGPETRQGIATEQNASEHGVRNDRFDDLQLAYSSSNGTTSSQVSSVPMGPQWQGKEMSVNISNLQENRTWLTNPGFDTADDWTTGTDDVGIYSNSITSEITDGYARFTMLGESSGDYYRFDEGDRAYVEQEINVNRGEVTWVGVSVDYWVYDAWGNPPIGFWEIYVQVGHDDVVANQLWSIQFSDVPSISTWYSSGVVQADESLIGLPNQTIQAGMRTTRTFGARPRLEPQVRIDNVSVFIKARATPSDVNLQMNGLDVLDVDNGTHTLWSLGQVTQTPSMPWTLSPVEANFTWTPNPSQPDPDIDIYVTFDAEISLTAEKINKPTLYQAEVNSYGERFEVQNSSQVQWLSYYYVAVPQGYSDLYHFNITNPSNRIMDTVAEPTKPEEDFSYWEVVDDYLNVSVYEGVTGSGQNGFWRVRSHSPNMINDLRILFDSSWDATGVYRANDNARFRAQLDPSYAGCTVMFYLYRSSGEVWTTVEAVVDSSGYAESPDIILDANDAGVGYWSVQAFVNDSISGGPMNNVGMYVRSFRIQHATEMSITYPKDSQTTWSKNVTLGQEMLLQIRINDSDNSDLLPGGLATYNWTTGTQFLNDMGTGEYSVVLDTSDLPSRGRYTLMLTWELEHYDSILRVFTLNIVEKTSLYSPDAPSVETPRGTNVSIEVVFADNENIGISDATIECNWTESMYSVTQLEEQAGHYILELSTSESNLDTYAVVITAQADYYISSQTTIYVEVRQLFTSVGVSTSYLPLPVGTAASIILTYTDTDNKVPITNAADAISCNWSAYHQLGDANYTIAEISPGEYEITFYSVDTDFIGIHPVEFKVEKYGVQNHTFTIEIDVQTHLTTFSLVNPIEPTPYTGTILIQVYYYDVTMEMGIGNGTGNDYNVLIYVISSGVSNLDYHVSNGTIEGEYIIQIPAHQWLSVGWKDLDIFANWTGEVSKYDNRTISTNVRISDTPASLFIGQNPVSTPYGEDLTFTVFYWDMANNSGIVNATGPYAYNVSMYVVVLSAGHDLNTSLIEIIEIGGGEYQVSFNTSYLSGLTSCDLRVYANWTKGKLPLYSNVTLAVTVRTTYRQTSIEYSPLPLTPYDSPLDFTFYYVDVLSGSAIENSSSIAISIQETNVALDIFYLDSTGQFIISLNTTRWAAVGSFQFHLNVTWAGSPYYQNRTGVAITVNIRERYTSLTHGSYGSVQYGNNLTLLFTYTDLDDGTHAGINGHILTLDQSLNGYYTIYDNGDGTYTLELDSSVFPALGVYTVNASISYTGSRFAADASDYFYLTLSRRLTQLTSDLPELAPYLTQANITIQYIDDNNGLGIENAAVFISCDSAAESLEKDVNYWVDPLGDGNYRVRISTTALGTFGSYSISITVNYTGAPFYAQRFRTVDIEVSRRPLSLSISESPLNTPYLETVSFEMLVIDGLDDSGVDITKLELSIRHGSGIYLLDSEYSLTGESGLFTITINSTTLVSNLVQEYQIVLEIIWGDVSPFYSNATTSTEVTITSRFTQSAVLSTPPAHIYFNASAVIEYTDYLSGDAISEAQISIACMNTTDFSYWVFDNLDGTYQILINTTDLGHLGRYFFTANISYSEEPFYANLTSIPFSITVNPVSTTLSLGIEPGTTYYIGDVIIANVTFRGLAMELGIENASIGTDWYTVVGNLYEIDEIGDGIYRLTLETTGLSAQSYTFSINASKYHHVNQTVTIEILLAPIPVSISMGLTPIDPVWGDTIDFVVNVTDRRNGDPISSGSVNLTLASEIYELSFLGGSLYGANISTSVVSAGEYTVTVSFALEDHESRTRDFVIRISKVDASLSAIINPTIAVNGQNISMTVHYLTSLNGTPIESGTVTFNWEYGQGTLTWDESEQEYIGHMIISDVPAGNHLLMLSARSNNYKTVTFPVYMDIREVTTQLIAVDDATVLTTIAGDNIELAVYLNNTDLSLPVLQAQMNYFLGETVGNLTELGDGFYGANISTSGLELRTWALTVFSTKTGYSSASLEFTVTLQRIPTEVVVISPPLQEGYYGRNVTFLLFLHDTHNDLGVENATTVFQLENHIGTLLEHGGGNYSLTVNTSLVTAGLIPHDISVSFRNNIHRQARAQLKLLVRPITTEVIGIHETVFPIGDDYSQLFTFKDTLNDRLIKDATANAVWEFGTVELTNLRNGSYWFGPDETNRTRLDIRSAPYSIRIVFTRGNHSTIEFAVQMTIRAIRTEIEYTVMPSVIYAGETFSVTVTLWNLDHQVAVTDYVSSVSSSTQTGLSLIRLEDEEVNYGNGTYVFRFIPGQAALYTLRITLDKSDYMATTISIPIYSEISPQQAMLVQSFFNATLLLLLLVGIASLYFKVLSVPKLLRKLRSMVSTLEKGRIPEPPAVGNRRRTLVDTMNELLQPIGIRKDLSDVAASTVDVSVLEVEELLEELGTLIGLSEEDLDVLRSDLEKMAPSGRAGFISEVLRQERFRRAKEIAESKAEEADVSKSIAEELTEDELNDIKERLLEMGVAEDEAELMIEHARSLSRAEVEALLESLGGKKE